MERQAQVKIAVILACHNRRALTVQAVEAVIAAADSAGVRVDFTIFDDGSTDGTEAALREIDASLAVLSGDGKAFWARSMAAAEKEVLDRARAASEPPDWILWLNDDVVVDKGAFATFLDSAELVPDAVFVGAMRDPESGDLTYSGLVRSGWHPLRFTAVVPEHVTKAIDSFNGNLVFVPRAVAFRIGGIDGEFSHALADIDYGLRCKRLGIRLLLLPSSCGTCPRNPPDPDDGLGRKWKRFVGIKGGGNCQSLSRILKKGSPKTWPLYVSVTYVMWWIRNSRNKQQVSSSRSRTGRGGSQHG